MSENAVLLPCPFCGTSTRDDRQEMALLAWLQINEIPGPSFYVECFGCGVEAGYSETEEDAIKAWNRRVYSSPADAVPAPT